MKKLTKKSQKEIDKAVKTTLQIIKRDLNREFKTPSAKTLTKAIYKETKKYQDILNKESKTKMFSNLKVWQEGNTVRTSFKYQPLPQTIYTVPLPEGFTTKDAQDIIDSLEKK